jgi:membrane dipeptidase
MEHSGEAPVIVSHAACRAVYDHPRNVADDQLRALAERGGVIGVMAHPLVVDPDDRTLERLADHVDHAVAVTGVDHVALGGDFTRQIDRAVAPPDAAAAYLPPGVALGSAIEGLEGPQDYGALVAVLEARGYAGDELDLILHGNLIRLLREALPAA